MSRFEIMTAIEFYIESLPSVSLANDKYRIRMDSVSAMWCRVVEEDPKANIPRAQKPGVYLISFTHMFFHPTQF